MFELVIEIADFSLICFSLRNVAEGHHSAMYHALLIPQRTGAGLDPATLGYLWIAQKYLGGARLSTDRTYQGESFGGIWGNAVRQVVAIMFGPLLGGKVGWAIAHYPFCRPIPN